jgi:hypothetical protein
MIADEKGCRKTNSEEQQHKSKRWRRQQWGSPLGEGMRGRRTGVSALELELEREHEN